MNNARPAASERRRGRVLAVDDKPEFLALMRELVGATDLLEVVAEAESGPRAIQLARELEPDLIVIDLWMPGMDGMAAAKEIKGFRAETVIVLTSTTHPDEVPPGATDGFVDAFVWKSELQPRLLDEIWSRSVAGGSSTPL